MTPKFPSRRMELLSAGVETGTGQVWGVINQKPGSECVKPDVPTRHPERAKRTGLCESSTLRGGVGFGARSVGGGGREELGAAAGAPLAMLAPAWVRVLGLERVNPRARRRRSAHCPGQTCRRRGNVQQRGCRPSGCRVWKPGGDSVSEGRSGQPL